MLRAHLEIIGAVAICCTVYLLTLRWVAEQCIEVGGWDNAFHRYECKQVF